MDAFLSKAPRRYNEDYDTTTNNAISLGWIPIDRKDMGIRSRFYSEDWQFMVRPAQVSAIKNWSAIDESRIDTMNDVFNDIIKSCGDKKHQKLLMTIYVMARWNGNEYGWTSSKCKLQHIKKSANLNMSNNDFYLLLHDLITNGYINNTKKVGKFCFQPLNYNNDKNEKIAFEVDSFDNIGNKFIASQSNTHTTCCICGRLIKKISPRTKYCAKCAKEVHKEQDKLYRQNKRK